MAEIVESGTFGGERVGMEPVVRRIGVADLRAALRAGWTDFQLMPTYLMLLAFIYPVIGLLAARAAMGNDLLPLVFPLVSGFALVGPIAGLGLYELSRRHEAGLSTNWSNMFDVLRSPALGTIVILAGVLLVLFVGWLFAALAIYDGAFGRAAPTSIASFVHDVMTTPRGWRLIALGNAVGLVFAVATLAVSVVSFPMALDRNVDPLTAIRTSVRAVTTNPGTMARWGLIVAGLLLLGGLALGAGLAVAIPVLGHATWHLYRRTIA